MDYRLELSLGSPLGVPFFSIDGILGLVLRFALLSE
jgi:hypothetical protein